MRTTIGVEEEFVLLDPETLVPVERAREAQDALRRAGNGFGRVMAEFFPSQLEFASPVCETAGQALASITGFREELSAWAAENGLIACGVGLPYRVAQEAEVTDEPRYREIASHFGLIVRDHQLNGLHVHVGVADRDAAVAASNALRPWLPVLLALSANSPYWNGVDTGFDSWRAIHSRRWTTHGIPPRFLDAADYDRRTAALRGVGGTSDAGTLNWVVRPSERYPTVEVRVFDAQLDPETSVALASIVRGLVLASAGRATGTQAAEIEPELLDSALWHAARNGLAADLLDPRDGSLADARAVVRALLDAAAGGLAEQGDTAAVSAVVDRILREGNGATRQRAAMTEGGMRGLTAAISADAVSTY
ncbi:glutamate--cysteine ligase [Leifsonia sp. NPDC102414]|uniref:carboxylate-amine ligase n=1 Tax=Leifsonia sp. NPDC102414 TaxID=3364124 RepID=UPI0037FC7B64